MAERPDFQQSWPEVPEGHEVVAVPDSDWRVVPADDGRSCRRKTGKYAHCPCRAVAEFRRFSYRARGHYYWWAYCAEHMYGRWIEDGQVMSWILRPISGEGS